MSFGDFNHDGNVDGRDYALYKISTGDDNSTGSSGSSGGGGCLTMIVVILILYGIVKSIAG